MGASGAMLPAMMAMSAASSIGTAYSQSRAIKSAGEYQASIADENAKIAGIEANQTIDAGDVAASRKGLQTQQTVASLRAMQGASGTDVSSGSNALTRIGTDFAGKIDELTIRNNAYRQAWGIRTQALQDTFQGQMTKLTSATRAQQTLLTGGINAIAGPASIYANYQRFNMYRNPGGSSASQPFDMSTEI